MAVYEEVLQEARSILETGACDSAQRAESLLSDFIATCDDDRDKGMATLASAQLVAMDGHAHAAMEHLSDAGGYLSSPQDRLSLYISYATIMSNFGLVDDAKRIKDALSRCLMECAIAKTTNLPFGYVAMARLGLLMGDVELALSAANTAVKEAEQANVGKAEAYEVLSRALEQSGSIEEAMDALDQAMINMAQQHCIMEAQARYADLALKLGDTKTAAAHLRRAMEVPDFRERRVLSRAITVLSALTRRDPERAAVIMDRLAASLDVAVQRKGVTP